MKNTIKISLLIISMLVLTGCFESADTTQQTGELVNFIKYDAQRFSISIPQDWDVIEPKDFSKDVPNTTQVIFRDNIDNDIFTTNANVAKVLLTSPMSSYDYARAKINENQNSMLNYKEIVRDEEFNIVIGGQLQKSILIMFAGKERETDPTIRVVQVFAVQANEAYTATAAYLEESDVIASDEAKNIVKSFLLK